MSQTKRRSTTTQEPNQQHQEKNKNKQSTKPLLTKKEFDTFFKHYFTPTQSARLRTLNKQFSHITSQQRLQQQPMHTMIDRGMPPPIAAKIMRTSPHTFQCLEKNSIRYIDIQTLLKKELVKDTYQHQCIAWYSKSYGKQDTYMTIFIKGRLIQQTKTYNDALVIISFFWTADYQKIQKANVNVRYDLPPPYYRQIGVHAPRYDRVRHYNSVQLEISEKRSPSIKPNVDTVANLIISACDRSQHFPVILPRSGDSFVPSESSPWF